MRAIQYSFLYKIILLRMQIKHWWKLNVLKQNENAQAGTEVKDNIS